MTVVEWCVSGAKDLRFIGREFHKRVEKLQNDRSANFILVKTDGWTPFLNYSVEI